MEDIQDYFKVGTREKPVISNSSLTYIDPNTNGSPQAFLNFFEEKQEQEKSYYRMGHLIHKWCENKENFTISEVEKPSDKLGIVADCALALVKGKIEDYKLEPVLEEPLVFTKEDYEDIILDACRQVNWNGNWGDAAIIKNAYPSIQPYLEDIVKAENSHKIYVSKKEAETIAKCTEAVQKHSKATDLLFMIDTDFSNVKIYKEIEIYWQKLFTYSPGLHEKDITLYHKAKLDSLVIDFDKKKITYSDPKTTSQGAYGFSKSFISYHYYRQQAFYNWAIIEFCKQQNIDITGFTWENYNIVIETNGLFQVGVYEVTVDWLAKGKKEYQDLIRRLVEHTATNQWNYSLEEMRNNLVMTIPFEV